MASDYFHDSFHIAGTLSKLAKHRFMKVLSWIKKDFVLELHDFEPGQTMKYTNSDGKT